MPSDSITAFNLVAALKYFGVCQVAVIYANSAYGRGLLLAFQALAQQVGLEVAFAAAVADSLTTPVAQLAPLVNAVLARGIYSIILFMSPGTSTSTHQTPSVLVTV